MDICLSPARAAASRRNGAKSRGPQTPQGKARSAQNALRHGLRAQKHVVLPGESAAAFAALEAALMEEFAPDGALQSMLAQRVVAATWRLERAERLEAGLFGHHLRGDRNLGLALIRDGNGPRAFDTLLRYRGGTLAELWRALRTLKALQAERAARPGPAVAPEQRLLPEPHETPIEPEACRNPREPASVAAGGKDVATVTPTLPEEPPAQRQQPIEPEALTDPRGSASVPAAGEAVASATSKQPIEPEARANPGGIAPAPAADAGRGRLHEERIGQVTRKSVRVSDLCAMHASPPTNGA